MKLKNIKKFIINNKKILTIVLLLVLMYYSLKPLKEGKTSKKEAPPNMEHLDEILKRIEDINKRKGGPADILKKNPITPKETQRLMTILNKGETFIANNINYTIFRSKNPSFQGYIQKLHGLLLGRDGQEITKILDRIKLAKKILQNDNGGSAPASSKNKDGSSSSFF